MNRVYYEKRFMSTCAFGFLVSPAALLRADKSTTRTFMLLRWADASRVPMPVLADLLGIVSSLVDLVGP
jgi:hypothetical protein